MIELTVTDCSRRPVHCVSQFLAQIESLSLRSDHTMYFSLAALAYWTHVRGSEKVDPVGSSDGVELAKAAVPAGGWLQNLRGARLCRTDSGIYLRTRNSCEYEAQAVLFRSSQAESVFSSIGCEPEPHEVWQALGAGLLEDVCAMELDRSVANPELLSDLFVRISCHHKPASSRRAPRRLRAQRRRRRLAM